MEKAICNFFFKLFGWKVILADIKSIKKAIFIVTPHTTWIDFLIGLGVRAHIDIYIGYLGKKELFDLPIVGKLFPALGGFPVDRFSNKNKVEEVVDMFSKNENMLIALAPEGTRKNVDKLRTGFYYMALAAKVPIIMVGFEFPTKTIIFNKPFIPTGNLEADLKEIANFYKNIKGVQKDWINNY